MSALEGLDNVPNLGSILDIETGDKKPPNKLNFTAQVFELIQSKQFALDPTSKHIHLLKPFLCNHQADEKAKDLDDWGFSPLHLSIIKGHIRACEILLETKPFINVRSLSGLTPLHLAVLKNDLHLVRILLDANADISLEDNEGFSALHYAVSTGDEQMLRYLLENGGVRLLHKEAKDSLSPIAISILKGYHNIQELLKSYGAKEEDFQAIIKRKMLAHTWGLGGVSTYKGKLIKLEGSWSSLTFSNMLFSLHSFSAYLNKQSKKEPLKKEDQNTKLDELKADSWIKLLKSLQATFITGLPCNLKEEEKVKGLVSKLVAGEPVLISSGWQGHMTCVVMGKIGAQLYMAKCNRGALKASQSIELFAIRNTHYKNLEFAISNLLKDNRQFFLEDVNKVLALKKVWGIDQKAQKVGNCTWANLKSGLFMLILLHYLQENINSFPDLISGESLHLDRQRHLLLEESLAFYKLWSAFERKEQLSDYLASNNKEAEDVLFLYQIWKKASHKGWKKEIEEIFIKNGFELSKSLAIHSLFLAVESGSLDFLKTYVEKGTPIDQANENGATLLHVAATCGYKDIVQYLIEKGANTKAKDAQGSTALHLASFHGHTDVLELLLKQQVCEK